MASLLQWQCHDFAGFSLTTLYEMLALRERVFVLEQQSIYGDLDGLDQMAWHICGRNDQGRLMAYARLIAPGDKYPDAAAITRVIVDPVLRGRGIGKRLLAITLDECEQRHGSVQQQLSAQVSAQRLYQELGFVVVSDPYDDGGIPHVDMLRTPTT